MKHKNKEYHTVGTILKIPHCLNNSSGRTTGIVFDAGDGVSHVVPIYEGNKTYTSHISLSEILELFRQCGIFRIVPTVWYF
jgi:actin-related protein